MLGGFLIAVDGNQLSDEQNQMNKLWNLLAYLIFHRKRMVPQREFLEQFWPNELGTASVNALKTQLFRIRKLLAPLFQEGAQPILSFRGGYQWNPDFFVELDLEQFMSLCQRISRPDTSAAKRITLLQEALTLYRGEMLPKLSQHAWVREQSQICCAHYLSIVATYAEILEKNAAYEQEVTLLRNAIKIYPLEEHLHTGIVRALLKQEKHSEALLHYELATDLLYRNLGIQPWKELRALYDQIMATEQLFEADLTVIQQELRETVQKEGAFFCEYGNFREIYRLEARRALRNDSDTHIVLLTLLNKDGSVPEAKVLEKTMQQIKDATMHSLRSGDVFTRYSSAQHLIMLPDTSLEAAELIVGRISSRLWRYRTPRLKVSARVRKLNIN